MSNSKNPILCIDDDSDTRELIEFALSRAGFDVIKGNSAEDGLALARRGGISAIILEYRLAGISGVEICRRVREFDPKTPIVFFTASAYPDERQAGLAAGAQDYLVKPTDFPVVAETAARLVNQTALKC